LKPFLDRLKSLPQRQFPSAVPGELKTPSFCRTKLELGNQAKLEPELDRYVSVMALQLSRGPSLGPSWRDMLWA